MPEDQNNHCKVAGAARLVMVFLVLVAFISQTIVAQTHMHAGAWAATVATTLALKDGSSKQTLPAKSPSRDDPANCPICQGLAHVGSYMTPSIAAMIALTVVASILVIHADFGAITQPQSHDWKSRAPPLV